MNPISRTIAHRFLDVLYPRACAVCNREVADETHYLCWDCLACISSIKSPFCDRCGDPVEGRIDASFVCYACTSTVQHYDAARSALRFEGVVKDLLHSFKYNQALWLTRDLGNYLFACATSAFDVSEVDFICPVPLYVARQRERGYNQAGILAMELAGKLKRPVLLRALVRKCPTSSQTNLTALQRLSNVKGAFEVSRRKAWPGTRVLLVDDVMTTGATVNECAKTLKEAGATRVTVLTVARG